MSHIFSFMTLVIFFCNKNHTFSKFRSYPTEKMEYTFDK